MTRPIGIDLGTTNSVVAFLDGKQAETIPNSEGHKTTPSIVLYGAEEMVVGEAAKRQCILRPRSTVRSVKRLMGRRYSEIKDQLGEYPFQISPGPEDTVRILLEGGREITPEEVSAAILMKMRTTAEDYLGEEIDQAVVTVPAYFNDSQRSATKAAAELAGLEVLRVVNEPTAAALAYGLQRSVEEKIAVFDFGGGTFDISLLQLSKGIFEVLATNGDTHLGGDDLDLAIQDWIVAEILAETQCDASADAQALQRIRETAEKVKCELSTLETTTISLPFIVADASGPKHFNRELNRTKFLELVKPILDRLLPPCRQALEDASLTAADISAVLLVGGSTRIPTVQDIVKSVFECEPSRTVNPDEAVALGAAIQSGIISGSLEEVLLLDVVPLSLGIELAGGVFKPLISRNSSFPVTATRKFTTVVDNQTTVLVHVLQGERKVARENRTLSRFRLMGIMPSPRELPEIEVRFHIDANGILEVSAQDMTSGIAQTIVVESYASTVGTQQEIERIIREAGEHAAEDEAFIKTAYQLQRIQSLQNRMNKFLEFFKAEIEEKDVKTIKDAMIRLDAAAAAQEWREIDAVELEIQLLRGRYGPEGEVPLSMMHQMPSGGPKTAPQTALPPIEPPAASPSKPPESKIDSTEGPSAPPHPAPEKPAQPPAAKPAAAAKPATPSAASAPAPAPLKQPPAPSRRPPTPAPDATPPGATPKKFTPPAWLFPGAPSPPPGGKKPS
jgi:molecular chaperone DnaK